MSIDIRCQCGLDYRLDDSRAGEKFTCKVCNASIILPSGVGRAIPQPAEVPQSAQTESPTPPPAKASPPPTPSSWAPLGESLGESLTDEPPAQTPPADPAPSQPVAKGDPAPQPAWTASREHDDAPMPGDNGPQKPPISWCVVRLLLVGICGAFLAGPWFSTSVIDGETGMMSAKGISGFGIVRATAETLGKNEPVKNVYSKWLGDYANIPSDNIVNTGGIMLVCGPCVYALGILLAIPMAFVTVARSGKHAIWPFVVCWVGLLSFVVGWRMIAGVEPISEILDVASQVDVSVGATSLAWTMLGVVGAFALIARSKPDYKLLHAMQWSEERSNPKAF